MWRTIGSFCCATLLELVGVAFLLGCRLPVGRGTREHSSSIWVHWGAAPHMPNADCYCELLAHRWTVSIWKSLTILEVLDHPNTNPEIAVFGFGDCDFGTSCPWTLPVA